METGLNKIKELIENNENEEEKEKISIIDKRKYSDLGLDKRMTIGMEIESEGKGSKIILESPPIFKKWKTKYETSLKDGVEIVSPILHNNKKDVDEIYKMCGILKKAGQKITSRCGGHIHIGADYLTSEESYLNLLEIWGNAEKLIYIISNKEGEIPREDLRIFAKGTTSNIENAMNKGIIKLDENKPLDLFTLELKSKIQRGNRRVGLNLLNINKDEKNTIEFRLSNGTLDPNTWIENIKLFGKIIEKSEELGKIDRKPESERKEEEIKLLNKREKLKQKNKDDEKIEDILDLLFTEEEKEVYRNRYKANSEMIKKEENKEIRKVLERLKPKKIINFHKISEYKEIAKDMKIGEIAKVERLLINITNKKERDNT